MSTFLRLTLARPEGEAFLINADHVVRIHSTWPNGCVIVTTDNASLNVTATLADIQKRLCMTGGRTHVARVEPDNFNEAYEKARADLLP